MRIALIVLLLGLGLARVASAQEVSITVCELQEPTSAREVVITEEEVEIVLCAAGWGSFGPTGDDILDWLTDENPGLPASYYTANATPYYWPDVNDNWYFCMWYDVYDTAADTYLGWYSECWPLF
jgi:hypothetical protein